MRHPDARRVARLLNLFEVSRLDCQAALNELIQELEDMRRFGYSNPDVAKILKQSEAALKMVALYLGLEPDE